MTTHLTPSVTRRGILKALGIGAAAALIEEPVRKLWFVGSNAPVGSRIERPSSIFSDPVIGRGYREALDEIADQGAYDLEALREQLFRKINSQEALDEVRRAVAIADGLPVASRDLLLSGFRHDLQYNNACWDDFEEYEADHPNNNAGTLVMDRAYTRRDMELAEAYAQKCKKRHQDAGRLYWGKG